MEKRDKDKDKKKIFKCPTTTPSIYKYTVQYIYGMGNIQYTVK